MRLLLTLILVVSAFFGAYWVVVAQMIPRYGADALAGTLQMQASPGRVSGFPLAFRTELADPAWRDAQGSVLWRTPRLDIQTPSYQPHRVQLDFPVPQFLELPGLSLQIDPEIQIITAVLQPDLTVREAQIEIETLQITPPVQIAGLHMLQGSLVQEEAGLYAATLAISDLRLSDDLRQKIAPSETLPALIDSITLDASLTFTAPFSLRDATPDLIAIEVTRLRLDWGDLALTLSGAVERSDSGLFDGQLTLHSNTWQGLHQLLGSSGLLARDAVMLAGMFLAAQADPGTGEITLPLSVTQSAIALGPFVLGYLPGR